MTPMHARLAMALLDVDRTTVGNAIGVDKQTVSAFLGDKRAIGHRTLVAMEGFFKSRGIVFLEDGDASAAGGLGVRLKGPAVTSSAGTSA